MMMSTSLSGRFSPRASEPNRAARRTPRARRSPSWRRVDVLVGRETDVVRRNGHLDLKTFGVGRDKSQRAWRSVLRQLFAAGAVEETGGEYPGLRLTEKGEAILFGRERIALRAEPERRARRERGILVDGAAVGLAPGDEPLFQHLRAVRGAIARGEGVP